VISQPTVTPEWKARFKLHYREWLDAICLEAEHRVAGRVIGVQEHLEIRRKTVALMPFIDLTLLFTESAPSLPSKSSGTIAAIENLAVELMILQNVCVICFMK
jgi:hypothetical protein